MKLIKKRIRGIYEITSNNYEDERGFMDKIFDKEVFKTFGLKTEFVQDTHSYTKRKYTVRGLHYTLPPMTEAKLIKCLNGKTMWVAVDLRKKSPTFGQHESMMMEKGDRKCIYIDEGFAHGCVSLSDSMDIVLLANKPYVQEKSVGIVWNDKDLNIDWRLGKNKPFGVKAHPDYLSFKDFKNRYLK